MKENVHREELSDQLLNRAMSFYQTGNLANASLIYKEILGKEPNNAYVLNILGVIDSQLGNHDSGINLISQAISISPGNSSYYNNLAKVYFVSKNIKGAIYAYQQALGRDKDNIYALNGLGTVFDEQNQLNEAITCYKKALVINANYIEALSNMGITLNKLGAIEDCIKYFERALEISPYYKYSIVNLFTSLQSICSWDKLEKLVLKLDQITNDDLSIGKEIIEPPFLNISRKMDPEQNYKVACSWSNSIIKLVSIISPTFNFAKRTFDSHIINLGYVSSDFNNHPVAQLIQGLFGLHDRDHFKVYLYSHGKDDGSKYRKKMMEDSDRFIDIKGYNSVDAANKIFQDKIDILIDLNGYTKDNKLDIFAMKPAPVQVAFLGFPGTTGATFIDYIIADKIVVPHSHIPFYSEKIVYMPHCYQVNDYTQKVSEGLLKRSDCSLPEGPVVFCSANKMNKIDPIMFDSWMSIMRRTPKSVLWQNGGHHTAERNLRMEAKARGIGPDRLIFAHRFPEDEHPARLSLADIMLDTRVYNGQATCSDAVRAGIPIITLEGKHFASRVASSILNTVGLPELVAKNIEEYEDIAINLANSPSKLAYVRQKLRKNLLTSPLLDTPSYAKSLESAYKKMWSLYCNGKGPEQMMIQDPQI